MPAVVNHFAQHPWRMLGCVVAIVFVAAAISFAISVLAAFGALMRAATMVMMRIMFSMMRGQ